MKSLKKMADLADRFELKIKYAQISGEDPKAVTTDAFFGPNAEQAFQDWIMKSNSNFLQALPDGVNCNIGASVNTSNKMADFLVALAPGKKGVVVPPTAAAAVKAALIKDFMGLHQGKDPAGWMAERLAKPPNDPLTLKPGIVSSHPAIIKIT